MAESVEIVGEAGKRSKIISIIAMLVLLLAGGGAGYFLRVAESTEVGDEQAVPGAVEEPEEPGVNELLYAELKKPLIVNFSRGFSARLIQVSVTLLVKNQETVEALKNISL